MARSHNGKMVRRNGRPPAIMSIWRRERRYGYGWSHCRRTPTHPIAGKSQTRSRSALARTSSTFHAIVMESPAVVDNNAGAVNQNVAMSWVTGGSVAFIINNEQDQERRMAL